MLYNLRSDIIYYKSGSDFELEFNLCGCCRMRLLTDKPSNKKTFVHSLARAVSRSRVILIAGPLFGEENTIEIVAQALGTTTETVDNSAYNIASDDEIEIIKGSLPLVSSDGSFGGCIIESGPQTMILLTDNKTLRKSIMTNLIHPYISELYAAELRGNSKTTAAEEKLETEEEKNEIILDDNTIIDESNIIEETTPAKEVVEGVENTVLETNEEFSLVLEHEEGNSFDDIKPEDIFIEASDTEDEEYTPQKDITIDDLIPPSPELEDPARTIDEKLNEAEIVFDNEEYISNELPEEYEKTYDDLFISTEKEDDQPQNNPKLANEFKFLDDEGEIIGDRETIFENHKSGLSIATIIFTVILLLAIIALCVSVFTASTSEGMAPSEYIKSVFETLFG